MLLLTPNAPLPPLRRRLEAVPVEEGGKPLFLLRDLEEISQQTLAVSPGGMLAASFLDGQRTAAEVSALFAKATGEFLKTEDVLKLVDELDQALLLETPKTAARRMEILKLFMESPARKAAFAGLSYPKEPLDLSGLLGGYFTHPQGPGKDKAAEGLAAPPVALVSPHIDFQRGGPAYAWAYQALSECRPPDVIVALGVAHMSPNSPWVMTKKSYETPYGAMAVDEAVYRDIREALWYDPLDDEWAHRTEHSLEFQAVWLRYLWREKTPSWVPILCSSFERFSPENPPSSVATVEGAIAAVAAKLKALQDSGKSVMILAGVDLAHVGPRFGDDLEIDDELKKKIEGEDRKSLEHALALDADQFYRSAVRDGHWRKICGLSALYTALRLSAALVDGAGKRPGRLLTYGQAPDPAGGLVSFAGAVFPG